MTQPSPQRVSAILWRAFKGETAAEIAAALQLHPREIRKVLSQMAGRLDVHAPPRAAHQQPHAPMLPLPVPWPGQTREEFLEQTEQALDSCGPQPSSES